MKDFKQRIEEMLVEELVAMGADAEVAATTVAEGLSTDAVATIRGVIHHARGGEPDQAEDAKSF
jgi:hypothetical protein